MGLVEALPDLVCVPIGIVDLLIFQRDGGANLMEMCYVNEHDCGIMLVEQIVICNGGIR